MERALCIPIYASGVGSPKPRRCAIPQGCPFSMLFLSLLTTVWLAAVRQQHQGVFARVLTDDLM
eukprot:5102020-Alexandrium_andersonii.AAC.1